MRNPFLGRSRVTVLKISKKSRWRKVTMWIMAGMWEILRGSRKSKNCYEPKWFGKFREIENSGGDDAILYGYMVGWLLTCSWTCWVCGDGFRRESIWQAIQGKLLVSRSDKNWILQGKQCGLYNRLKGGKWFISHPWHPFLWFISPLEIYLKWILPLLHWLGVGHILSSSPEPIPSLNFPIQNWDQAGIFPNG